MLKLCAVTKLYISFFIKFSHRVGIFVCLFVLPRGKCAEYPRRHHRHHPDVRFYMRQLHDQTTGALTTKTN